MSLLGARELHGCSVPALLSLSRPHFHFFRKSVLGEVPGLPVLDLEPRNLSRGVLIARITKGFIAGSIALSQGVPHSAQAGGTGREPVRASRELDGTRRAAAGRVPERVSARGPHAQAVGGAAFEAGG